MQETGVQFLGWEDPLEKEMAIHSSTLAWKIPWTEEFDRLQSTGSQRVGLDWATSLYFIVDVQYYISYRYIIYKNSHFKGYTIFTVITKYWLYSLCCTINPCSLFYIQLFLPINPLPLYCPSWFPLPLVNLVCSLYLWVCFLFHIFTSLLYFFRLYM